MRPCIAAIALAVFVGGAVAAAQTPTQSAGDSASGSPSAAGTGDLPPKLANKLNHTTKGGKHSEDAAEQPAGDTGASDQSTADTSTAKKPSADVLIKRPAMPDPHGEGE